MGAWSVGRNGVDKNAHGKRNNLRGSMINKLSDNLGVNRVVLALSFARLGDAIGNSILFIVIPLFVAKLPAPWFPFPETVRIGFLIAVYGIVNAVFQPVMGAFSDHLNRRKPFIQLGLLLMGGATLAYILASHFVDLLLLRIFQGIGVALTIPASMALMAVATQKRSRGGSMGIYSTMRMLGFAIGPLLGGLLYEKFGFDAAFVVGSGFILLGILLVELWVQEAKTETSPGDKKPEFKLFERNLLSGGILGTGFATFVMAADFSMISDLENQFNARLNQTALDFGIAFSALIVSRLIFQIPLGRWSDKIGRKPLIIAGLLLMMPATLLLGYVESTLQFTGLRVVQGLASAAIAAPAFALAADLSRKGGEGRQMSVITMGFGLGIAIGPLITGILAVQSFTLPFVILSLITLAVLFIVYRYVPETIHKEKGREYARGAQSRPSEGD
jgi:MFS family permease